MTTRNNSSFSRRAFLKKVGAGTAMLLGSQLLIFNDLAYASGGDCECECECECQSWGILIDLTRCIGCDSCALACKASNNLPNVPGESQALGSDTYSLVEDHLLITADGETKSRHVKRQCMHCLHAACVAACPTAAMYKSKEGPVIYRSERCMGCRYCQMACPFGVPSFEWDNGTSPVISKCWLCYDRIKEGQTPACAEACPSGALRFDRRDKLLIQAHAQIASHPGRYVDHVFGEYEVGGTSMLYLSDVPFERLAFPVDLPHTAPPEESEKILKKLPFVLVGMAALMSGTAAYTHHRPVVHEYTGDSVQDFDGRAIVLPPPSSQGPQTEQSEEQR